MKKPAETESKVPWTVPRYRLSLVREDQIPYEAVSLRSPRHVAPFLFDKLKVHESPQERMQAIFLDARGRSIGVMEVFVGGLTRATVEPGPILQGALLANASGIVLSHNHPSGDPTPSLEDIEFTRRLREAAEVVGLQLVDHIVTGEPDEYISLRDRGAF